MRTLFVTSLIVFGIGLSGCSRKDRDTHQNEPAARQAGREAYRASQDIKKGAKEAAKELRSAGKEFREGWNEQKRQEPPPPPPPNHPRAKDR